MPLTHLFIAFWMLLAQGGGTDGPPPDLTAAKALYASGAYEDALTRLSTVRDDNSAAEAAQYRALCLLALGRTTDAQTTLEDLFVRKPLFRMSETEVAPRLVAMFHDVRRRLLPARAKDMYAKAKASFEQRQYAEASTQFNTLLALLAGDAESDEAPDLSDLRMLGEGFLGLAERELAAAAKAEAMAAANAAGKADNKPEANADGNSVLPPAPAPAESAPAPATIYSAANADVIAPVEIARQLPAWHPPNYVAARREYRGVLSVVVDEQGAVESANLVNPMSDAYDQLLLAAARLWKFKPALKNNQPVKYEKLFTISLSPR